MTSSRVRIGAVSLVRPSSPTIPDRVELSLLDTFWVSYPPTQRLFVFNGASLPPFPDLLDSLTSSLSRALSLYYPLAGKLVYVPSSGGVLIDCSGSPGVEFIEAEAVEGRVDVQRLAEDDVLDMDAFLQLVPDIGVAELPAPLLAVQVTRFGGGEGVVVGVASHHVAADGKAIWQFIEAWAAECRGEGAQLPPPVVDRTVISHPRAEEISRKSLQWVAPNLPKLDQNRTKSIEDRLRLARKTFVISPKEVELLKQAATKCAEGDEAARPPPPSSFAVVASHAWRAMVRSKCWPRDAEAFLVIPSDCRARTTPPIDERYLGNCIVPLIAIASVGDLLGEDGMAKSCAAIRNVIRRYLSRDPLKEDEDEDDHWSKQFDALDMSLLAHVAGSHRFRTYDMDFGWGRPSRAELVSINEDGQFSFACARDGVGIQMTVSLHPDHIQDFDKYFVDGLLR